MDDQNNTTSFTLEIDNFSGKKSVISPNFLSGGCEWYVTVRFPDGVRINDHCMYMYLYVGNTESLRLGWKIRASYSFLVLNQSLEELYRCDEVCRLFCDHLRGRGWYVNLEKIQEKGLFQDHPDIAKNLREKDQLVKAAYMNDLLSLIETLNKPPCTLSLTELSKSLKELMVLEEAGFKLNWLKKKHDEVSLEWKKANFDATRDQEFEEHAKNLKAEENKEKVKAATCAARQDWLEVKSD
ncbi:unnamed protein product, partial [Thlaspi arvense]